MKVQIEFRYTDDSNFKDDYDVITEVTQDEFNDISDNLNDPIYTMGQYGSLTAEQFFGGAFHIDEFMDDVDHNYISITDIKKL